MLQRTIAVQANTATCPCPTCFNIHNTMYLVLLISSTFDVRNCTLLVTVGVVLALSHPPGVLLGLPTLLHLIQYFGCMYAHVHQVKCDVAFPY